MVDNVGENGAELVEPVAVTAGEEDHSDPDVFRGEDADPPSNPDDDAEDGTP